jgi:hypothetical protein
VEALREDKGSEEKRGLSIGPSGAICRSGRRIGQFFLTGTDIRVKVIYMTLLLIT